jgi:hypothetical protein
MKRIRSNRNLSSPAEKRRFDVNDENPHRTDPFVVPKDYFNELPQRIMARIEDDSQSEPDNQQASPLLRRVWLAAAAAAAIALIFIMLKPSTEVPGIKAPIVNSTEAAILSADYDQTYADEAFLLDENKITDKEVSTLDIESLGTALFSSDTTAVASEEIIQYLLDENYDTDLLAEL